MPHIPVPAAELNTRLDRLRCAMTEKDPAWSMLLLDNTLDMYYFTGTMQDGALVVTPDQATLFVRRSFDVAKDESAFADIRPMGSFRGIKEVYPDIPETVYVAAKTMTLQKALHAEQASAVCTQADGRCAQRAALGQERV